MFVLEVIPFSRTAPQAPLSYRSRIDLPAGTIISIPLRKKIVPGLVIGSVPVREAKSVLKLASFTLSKSSEVVLGNVPSAFIDAARNVALYHATTLGAVLSATLMPVLPAEAPMDFLNTRKNVKAQISKEVQSRHKIERVEEPFIHRVESYRTHVEHGVTLLVVPTQTESDEWALLFKNEKPLVLSGKLTGKRREAALARILSADNLGTKLVISTPSFAPGVVCALHERLNRIIIERMSAGSYVLPRRPYIDVRFALTECARLLKLPIMYGDYPLPLENRKDPEASIEKVAAGAIEVIDVRPEKTEVKKDTSEWQAIPENILEQIKSVLSANGRVAVLAVRRGYAPTVVCRDCGTAVTDEHGRTLSLATIKGVRTYRANDGTLTPATEVFCKVCGGWNLTPLGIGVERLEEELHKAFPKAPIIRIDQDTRKAASLKKERERITEPGTIILGTEIMLPFISPYEPVKLGIIASADSLLALPFWRARERFVRIGRMLGERSAHTLIATRHADDVAFNALTNPTDTTFWTEEKNLRKILSYPPFGTIIVFHIEGSHARLEEARVHIRTACAPHIPHELSEQAIDTKGNLKSSLVLQLPSGVWPNKALSARLANVSPAIRITIDSEMLW